MLIDTMRSVILKPLAILILALILLVVLFVCVAFTAAFWYLVALAVHLVTGFEFWGLFT